MSLEGTRAAISRYLDTDHTDLSMMADDVLFTNMATGDENRGPEAVREMLNYIYHVAFDAKADVRNVIVSDGKAVMEADFVGKHIAEFAGIPATNKQVKVPLCVVYDLENDRIKRARIYFEVPALLTQLSAS
jgi:Predicted ester cyclase